jgi:hypothetical protein
MPPAGSPEDSPTNPFLRFKNHVDANVVSGFNTMIGYPSNRPPPSPPDDTESSSTYQPDYRDALSLRSLFFSSYSPASLRHLPQPIPNDLPSHVDGSIFTFEDAFEDLLAVSQGQALPDIQQKYQQRKLLQQMFPDGEPSWFWMRRLRASGLLYLPEPQHQVDGAPNWEALHRELERKAAKVWGRQPRDDTTIWDDMGLNEAMRALGSMFGEVERTVGSLEDAFRGRPRDSRDEFREESAEQTRQEPDTFDEFFSHVQSAYESGQRSWDTLMKTIANGDARYQTPKSASETKIEESRDEHVDRFGYIHSKVTRREIDSEGNEVSRSTSYQMYPAPASAEPKSVVEAEPGVAAVVGGDLTESDDKNTKNNGWFWK